ncbi:choice-of-anchor Q domain-containing protein [Anaerobaca lacustris]|uniref:Choice-of-anchor Q domain-containing protein n=1 Tax=Anaerobaca lacustris TaxID=3044600 RepID=A0AAW6TWY6_9BACT|nr:choice-of-anchor Q domain-containing protein [Sedimentisphaerales bacterium M17dextr]
MVWRPRCVFLATVLTCLLGVSASSLAATLYVDDSGKTGFSNVQAAVDAARDGDVIVIQPGTYTGRGNQDIDLQRKAIRIQSTDPNDPAVVEATIIDCGGTQADPHRGFHVQDFTGEIVGLTITNGLAASGGAVYCRSSVLTLRQCRIVQNATLPGEERGNPDGGTGGGVYCEASTVEMIGCYITDNSTGAGADSRETSAGSGGDGAGVYAVSSLLHVSDSTIADNVTGAGGDSDSIAGRGGNGAGIHADSLVVIRSKIVGNACGQGGAGPQGGMGGQGGGIHCSRATIAATMIEANRAGTGGDSTAGTKGVGGSGGHGGGLVCLDSLDLSNSLIAGNRAGLAGGTADSSVATLAGRGGGISCTYGVIDHCTIVGNVAFGQVIDEKAEPVGPGGGVACTPQTTITNSILWGNTSDQIEGHDCANVLYCDMEGQTCEENRSNISVDPLFVEAGYWADARDPEVAARSDDSDAIWVGGDYRLSEGSPCIDAADPDYVYDFAHTDLDGRPRLTGAAPDMGAYETHDLIPVYRFRSREDAKHRFTTSESEKDTLIDRQADTWEFEGVACYVYKRAITADLKPVYCFWSARLESYLYTISESEKNRLITTYSTDRWVYESIAFYAYPEGSQPEGAKPVYRFWSNRLGSYFYTIDEAERAQYYVDTGTWAFEGIAWYAFDTSYASDESTTPSTPDSSVVYEFTGGSDAASYVFQLRAYVDGQQAQLDNATIELTPAVGRMQIALDFDAMTVELAQFHVETQWVEHVTTVTQSAVGVIQFPVTLSLYGFFDALTPRGPYPMESRGLTFSTAGGFEAVSEDETFRIQGSANVDGGKLDVNLAVGATEFELDGAAAIDDSGYPDRLDVAMDGPFQWNRSQQDLLLETTIKGHTLEIYVDSMQVRPTGLWRGKNVSQAQQERK